MNRVSLIIGVGILLFAPPASAQMGSAKAKPAAGESKAEAKAEAERMRQARQEQARALLFALSGDARDFRNQRLRAYSLAKIADALWDVDAEQGRAIFREAWDAAQKADREAAGRLNLSGGVLRLAAKRDRLLAEEFLQKLKAAEQEATTESVRNSPPAGGSLWELPPAAEKRLKLAEHLLATGDVERALQFADPVLGSVTISTIDFLTLLRDKHPAPADKRYAAVLANAGANVQTDANAISVLSSYIFTPHTYVIFNSAGGADTASMSTVFPPANVGPQLRLAFFQTAGTVLLRPPPQPEQGQGGAGVVARYMALKRLMPLFSQQAPREIAEAMRGQFEALSAQVTEAVRQSRDESLQKGITSTEQLHGEREHSLLDRVEGAKTSDERDDLYFQLASLALGKDDPKARDYADRISEDGLRKGARAWVDAGLAINAIQKKKVEPALEFARRGELTHIQRVWVLTQAAKLLGKTDRERALSLIDEAAAEVGRIDDADPDRPRGLLATANALALLDPARAWGAAQEAIKAATSIDKFTGEGGALSMSANSKSLISRRTEPAPDFDVGGIFGKLASSDYFRAVQLARGFQGEAPRVNATIAIARAVLNEKSPPVASAQSGARN
ncbi:MAG TPA: hypothetical protein VGB98_14675 [Pyrinomonadaceae bacterium]|jgi:hypothetical protein